MMQRKNVAADLIGWEVGGAAGLAAINTTDVFQASILNWILLRSLLNAST